MKLEGFKVLGFDAKKRHRNGEVVEYATFILTNDDCDRMTVTTANRAVRAILVGESIEVVFSQTQRTIPETTKVDEEVKVEEKAEESALSPTPEAEIKASEPTLSPASKDDEPAREGAVLCPFCGHDYDLHHDTDSMGWNCDGKACQCNKTPQDITAAIGQAFAKILDADIIEGVKTYSDEGKVDYL